MACGLLLTSAQSVWAQPVPGADENIPYLMTFGKDSKTEWGDDNFVQIIFAAKLTAAFLLQKIFPVLMQAGIFL